MRERFSERSASFLSQRERPVSKHHTKMGAHFNLITIWPHRYSLASLSMRAEEWLPGSWNGGATPRHDLRRAQVINWIFRMIYLFIFFINTFPRLPHPPFFSLSFFFCCGEKLNSLRFTCKHQLLVIALTRSFPRSHEDLTYEKFASSNDLFIIWRDCSGDLS